MPSTRLAAAAAALLLGCAQLSSPALGDYVVSSTPTTSVPTNDQVSADQRFSKTWQIKGNPKIKNSKLDILWTAIPGRVFITYDDAVASELVAEIKVSGSSQAAVGIVDVFGGEENADPERLIGDSLNITRKNQQTTESGASLLTEVKIKYKNALQSLSAMAGDVVVEQSVLASQTKEETPRRLSEAAASDTPASGLVVKEVNATYGKFYREWQIQASSGVIDDAMVIALHLDLPGIRYLYRMNKRLCSDCVGRVMIGTETTSPTQVEVIAGRSGSSESLALQLMPNVSAASVNLTMYVGIYPSIQVTTSTIGDELPLFKLKHIEVLASGTANVFVVGTANDSTFVDYAFFTSSKNASLQMEFANAIFATQPMIYWAENTSTIVTYFDGKPFEPFAYAGTINTATICFKSANGTKVEVNRTAQASNERVWNTGMRGPAFECEKRAVPPRVPGKLNETGTFATDGKSAADSGSDKKSSSSSSLAAKSSALAYAISAALVFVSVVAASL